MKKEYNKYRYVGPFDVKEKTKDSPPGTAISSMEDLTNWIKLNKGERKQHGLL